MRPDSRREKQQKERNNRQKSEWRAKSKCLAWNGVNMVSMNCLLLLLPYQFQMCLNMSIGWSISKIDGTIAKKKPRSCKNMHNSSMYTRLYNYIELNNGFCIKEMNISGYYLARLTLPLTQSIVKRKKKLLIFLVKASETATDAAKF